MPTITIDCASIRTEAEFWQRYIDGVMPQGADMFGRNLDAFNDALAGGPGWPGDVSVLFANSSQLSGLKSGEFLAALREITTEHSNVSLV